MARIRVACWNDICMKRSVLSGVCACLSAASAALGTALVWLVWQRAGLPYNEEGYYFDGLVNYHQQAVLVYAVAAWAAWLLALGLAWAWRKSVSPGTGRAT